MRNYLPIQIVATLFLIFAIFRVIRKYREKDINFKEFFRWLILWLVIGIVFWLPQTTSFLANILGIGRGADLVIYVSIIVIFYLIFRLLVMVDKQQREITKIVRHLAIMEDEKNKKDYD